ncbi:ATP-binding protein [Streptomyces sp. NBC_00829]|uniref:ATP-binding protein n=1 Tax=Streptomyces sp. NBC_00829 TaxID=2903679 RepID=UPI0038640B6A|nr:ATP-binding protein [Streptomyces sp. NBC_00829]
MTVKMAPPRRRVSAAATADSPTVPGLPAAVGNAGGLHATAVFTVPADLGSTHHVRKLVVQTARHWRVLDEASLGDLELCAGEVVANAAEHTGTPSVVLVSVTTSGVRVELTDTRPQLPEPAAPDSDGESGRGLLLVDALASAWGAHPTGTGKTVWFEIPATPRPAGCEGLRQPGHRTAGWPTAA